MKNSARKRLYDANIYCIRKNNLEDKEINEDRDDELSALLNDQHNMLKYKNRLLKDCLKSKTPILFVAQRLEIPKKHIRDFKMLMVEMKERFQEEFEVDQICNIDRV